MTVAEIINTIDEIRNTCHKVEDITTGDTVSALLVSAIDDLVEYAERYIAELLSKKVKE